MFLQFQMCCFTLQSYRSIANKMHKFRNSVSEINVIQKSVEYCGKTIKKSKKKVKWVLSHKSMQHTLTCTVSFMSGKKKVVHNGLTIVQAVNNEENLNAVIMVGKNRVKIKITKDDQFLYFQDCNYQTLQNAFYKFKNIWSQEPSDIYSKFFNHT